MAIKKSNKKFKYLRTIPLQTPAMNDLGADGWELVAFDGYTMYFKLEV